MCRLPCPDNPAGSVSESPVNRSYTIPLIFVLKIISPIPASFKPANFFAFSKLFCLTVSNPVAKAFFAVEIFLIYTRWFILCVVLLYLVIFPPFLQYEELNIVTKCLLPVLSLLAANKKTGASLWLAPVSLYYTFFLSSSSS